MSRLKLENSIAWGVVIHSLLAIPSSSPLERVVLSLDFAGDQSGVVQDLRECVDWGRLEGVLESHISLEAVVVNTTSRGVGPGESFREVWEGVYRVIDSHLSRLSARRILQFTAPVCELVT